MILLICDMFYFFLVSGDWEFFKIEWVWYVKREWKKNLKGFRVVVVFIENCCWEFSRGGNVCVINRNLVKEKN